MNDVESVNASKKNLWCLQNFLKWQIVFEQLTDERRLTLFPARTIVRESHHRKPPTSRHQDLSLHIKLLLLRQIHFQSVLLKSCFNVQVISILTLCLQIIWRIFSSIFIKNGVNIYANISKKILLKWAYLQSF